MCGTGWSNAGVYQSLDGGANFTALNTNAPKATYFDLALSPDDKFLYAATSEGPYVYIFENNSWYDMSDGVAPFVDYRSVEYIETNNVVRFGTYGRGLWDFKVQAGTVPNDVAATLLTTPANLTCGNATISPKVTIKNNGDLALTSVRIKVYANDVLKQTLNHTTNLATGASQIVNLANIITLGNTDVKVVLDLPNGATDSNPNDNTLNQITTFGATIPLNLISIESFSSEETSGEGANNGRAIHAIDGNPSTFWHARWSSNPAPMPHTLVFDLGQKYNLSSFSWQHRQNNSNGNTKTVDVSVSDDGINWSAIQTISLQDITAVQDVLVSDLSGRYFRTVITSNFAGNNVSSLAEISFKGCEAPVTAIFGQKEIEKVSIYPNPTADKIFIMDSFVTEVELINLMGHSMGTWTNLGAFPSIDVSSYSHGTYYLKIKTLSGLSTQKIVIQ
jgi:hypothetical protein